MGIVGPYHGCRWVRDRLPLLDGGELAGADRRKVESHVLGCPDCRSYRESLIGALGTLQAAAAEAPGKATSEQESFGISLWPALQRQIREGRHEPRSTRAGLSLGLPLPASMPEADSWLDVLTILGRARPRVSFALAASLLVAGLAGLGVELWVRSRMIDAQSLVAAASQPVRTSPVIPEHSALDFGPSVVYSDPETSPRPDRTGATRLGYDLDHGTPMGSDTGMAKPSY